MLAKIVQPVISLRADNTNNSVLLRYLSFGLYRLKSYHVRFEQEKNALFVSH